MNRRNLIRTVIASTTLAIGKFITSDTASVAASTTAPAPVTTISGLLGIPEKARSVELRWRHQGKAYYRWLTPESNPLCRLCDSYFTGQNSCSTIRCSLTHQASQDPGSMATPPGKSDSLTDQARLRCAAACSGSGG